MKYQTMFFGKKENRITLTHLNKPIKKGLVGMVSSPLFNDNIAIVIDNNTDESRNYDFACLAYTKNYATPLIMLENDVYYDIKRGKPYAHMILLHELGHYYHKNISNYIEENDADREQLVSIGKVSENEIHADSFAADYMGVDAVISGLEQLKLLISGRCVNYEETNINTIIKEIDIRIKQFKN